jgi:molybdopterin-guanine dinucleotide biosynthesis protein A
MGGRFSIRRRVDVIGPGGEQRFWFWLPVLRSARVASLVGFLDVFLAFRCPEAFFPACQTPLVQD